jgi:hypothetical protein
MAPGMVFSLAPLVFSEISVHQLSTVWPATVE